MDQYTDEGEPKNVQAEHPEDVARLTKLLEEVIANGRSAPGPKQPNEIPIEIRKKPGKAAQE